MVKKYAKPLATIKNTKIYDFPVVIAFLKKCKNASEKIMAPTFEICVKVKIMKKIDVNIAGDVWQKVA